MRQKYSSVMKEKQKNREMEIEPEEDPVEIATLL